MPLPSPVPPSPETSEALLAAFAERNIAFRPDARIVSLDLARKVAALKGGDRAALRPLPRRPQAPRAGHGRRERMTEDGYVPVDSATLETRYPGVYAVGDVATVGVPKAGVFAEGAARVVAEKLIARVRGGEGPDAYDGLGSCYIEFGSGRVGRVDVDFLSGPGRRAPSTSPRPLSSPRRSASAPAAAPAGSAPRR